MKPLPSLFDRNPVGASSSAHGGRGSARLSATRRANAATASTARNGGGRCAVMLCFHGESTRRATPGPRSQSTRRARALPRAMRRADRNDDVRDAVTTTGRGRRGARHSGRSCDGETVEINNNARRQRAAQHASYIHNAMLTVTRPSPTQRNAPARTRSSRAAPHGCQLESMEKPHREPVPEYCLIAGVFQPPNARKSLKLAVLS